MKVVVGKGWSKKTPSCIECRMSHRDRVSVSGLCSFCKSHIKRLWPKWLDRCVRCERGQDAMYCKSGLCCRCISELDLLLKEASRAEKCTEDEARFPNLEELNGHPLPDGVGLLDVWKEVFDDERQQAKRGNPDGGDRTVKSIINLMSLPEASDYLSLPKATLKDWYRDGIPADQKLWVTVKKMSMSDWRPKKLESGSIDDISFVRGECWLEGF